MQKIVDLRSDTVTKPTPKMYEAMLKAPLGDDVLGDDPTVRELEEIAAQKTGFEAALFVPSGTMGNAIAVKVWTKEGSEVIVEEMSHIYNFEVAHLAEISRVLPRPLKSNKGYIEPDEIKKNIRKEGLHVSGTSLICLENTHNYWGGKVLTPQYLKDVREIADYYNIPIHLDGARIFNASVFLKIDVKEITRHVNSLMFCLSKGLSCPVGSILCASKEFIEKARRIRKMLGGGMRQAGVLAACGIVALNEMIERLEEDHKKAKKLAEGLLNIPWIDLDLEEVETNILIIKVKRNEEEICKKMKEKNVLALPFGKGRIRFVTHKDVDFSDIEYAVEVIKKI
ncbi:MAG: GntG family PLP-dependent aldolase [Candidatus Hydrothermales bacterium]